MAEAVNTTRRAAFKVLGFGAAVLPVLASPAQKTAHERMNFHLQEYKRAVEEIVPGITEWRGGQPAYAHPDDVLAIGLCAFRSKAAANV